jgi:hypothetical protein
MCLFNLASSQIPSCKQHFCCLGVYLRSNTSPLISIILSHVDPLLGNDREISKNTTAVTHKHVFMATIGNSSIGTVFSVRSVAAMLEQRVSCETVGSR